MRTWFNDFVLLTGLLIIMYTFIGVFWYVLELIFLGEVQPNIPDTIIGFLFALSIVVHLRYRLYNS